MKPKYAICIPFRDFRVGPGAKIDIEIYFSREFLESVLKQAQLISPFTGKTLWQSAFEIKFSWINSFRQEVDY